MISTTGVSFVPAPFHVAPASAAVANEKECDGLGTKILKTAFEQSNKMTFSELGWGNAEAKLLSQQLNQAKGLKKLYLTDNAITDEGVADLAASLKAGAAPKLKMIDLTGNGAVSETAKQTLIDAREGLSVSIGAVSNTAKTASVPKQVPSPSRKYVPVIARAEKDKVKALYTLAFEQIDTLLFSDLKLGDSEVEVLSQTLYSAKGLKKLFLNGNELTDAGAEEIATALRGGAAPQLKILNLSQKKPLSETTKRCIKGSREGLQVSFAALKQASDAPVYKAADDGKLKPARVIERAENTLLGTGQKLVDGSGATCAELQKIIDVDTATLNLERNKLNSKVGMQVYSRLDPEEVKKVERIEKTMEQQLERLDQLKTSKGCKA